MYMMNAAAAVAMIDDKDDSNSDISISESDEYEPSHLIIVAKILMKAILMMILTISGPHLHLHNGYVQLMVLPSNNFLILQSNHPTLHHFKTRPHLNILACLSVRIYLS